MTEQDSGDEAAKDSGEHGSTANAPEVGTRFSAAEIHENIVEGAEEELERPALELEAQVILIWLATAPIAALGFKHSIAGATEAFYLVWRGDLSLAMMLGRFEIPALIGNIIGGVVLVALLNYGQVRHTREQE